MKIPWSKYWIGKTLDGLMGMGNRKISDTERLMKLSNVRKGIAAFIRNFTGRANIPVKFSSGYQSYTDNNTIVISATDDPNKFDSMVGLALHESSHILHSQPLFVMLRMWEGQPEYLMNPDIVTKGERLGFSINKMQSHLMLIINFLEDRRIDTISYQSLGGYRPYYEALYDEYFYSDKIEKALTSPEFREQNMRSFEVHLLNMFSDKADPDALVGLREIWDIIDLPNIERHTNDPRWIPFRDQEIHNLVNHQYDDEIMKKIYGKNYRQFYVWLSDDDAPLLVQDARRILETIYDNVDTNEQTKDYYHEQTEDSFGHGGSMFDESEEFDDDELENFDGAGGSLSDDSDNDTGQPSNESSTSDGEDGDEGEDESGTLSDEEMNEIKKAIRRQSRLTNGKPTKDKLGDWDSDQMNNLETTDAVLVECGVDKDEQVNTIVYRKFNDTVAGDSSYPFLYSNDTKFPCNDSVKAIEKGIQMGQVLVHRLRIMNDESSLKYTRQDHGRIDKRLIHQLGYGTDSVFSVEHLIRVEPVMVDISLDSSGSMAGGKWRNAFAFCVAMCYVAEKTRNVRVRLNLRTSQYKPVVGIVYDSKVDKFSKVRNLFPLLGPTGGTPEGLAFEAIENEILSDIKGCRRFFVNLSDGEPYCVTYEGARTVHYHGESAAEHTANQVRKMREHGIHVMSYYISDYPSQVEAMNKKQDSMFHKMYGRDARYITMDSVSEITKTLNQFFLQE